MTKYICLITILIIMRYSIGMSQIKRVSNDNASQLLGLWRESHDVNATLEIRKKVIYYFEDGTSFKYKTKKDSIWIYYENWTLEGIYKISNDTLTTFDKEDHIQHFIKWK